MKTQQWYPFIGVPTPELKIHSTSTEVSTDEGLIAFIEVESDVDPRQPVTFKYTPTETGTEYLAPILEEGSATPKGTGDARTVTLEFMQEGENPASDDPWLATISLKTQAHTPASGTSGTIMCTC